MLAVLVLGLIVLVFVIVKEIFGLDRLKRVSFVNRLVEAVYMYLREYYYYYYY